mgnify:CR=1 FL=1
MAVGRLLPYHLMGQSDSETLSVLVAPGAFFVVIAPFEFILRKTRIFILTNTYFTYIIDIERRESKMPMTPREMIKLLEANGFECVSSNGSHRKYRNPATGKTTIVPFHAKDLKPGTEKNILKQAGIQK